MLPYIIIMWTFGFLCMLFLLTGPAYREPWQLRLGETTVSEVIAHLGQPSAVQIDNCGGFCTHSPRMVYVYEDVSGREQLLFFRDGILVGMHY